MNRSPAILTRCLLLLLALLIIPATALSLGNQDGPLAGDGLAATPEEAEVLLLGTDNCQSSNTDPVSVTRTPLTQAQVSRNVGTQLYTSLCRWNDIINSYLVENEDGSLTRVEYTGNTLVVERHIRTGSQVLWESGFQLDISQELPLFGGYYSDGEYHYLVFGQTNPEESDTCEVLRVVKYSKDWSTRLGSASLLGANTTIPFRAGTLRMAKTGNILYLRTSHEMYTTSDGLNHQANMTVLVDVTTMTITQAAYDISNTGTGYSSHSFNQFITTEDGHVVALDHGDAHPRSVALFRYPIAAGSSTLYIPIWGSSLPSMVEVFPITGPYGSNTTGVMVGALTSTGQAYLTAGTAVVQDDQFASHKAYNVFLTATPASNFTAEATTTQYLSSYQEEDKRFAGPPYLVKVAENKYLLLWSGFNSSYYNPTETGKLFYAYVDANGTLLSQVKQFSGFLSDCTPIAVDGGALWYTTFTSEPVFYYLKEDALLIDDHQEEINTLELQYAADLVCASYSEAGQLLDTRMLPLTANTVTDLPTLEGTQLRYFLLEKENQAPLPTPFH